MVNLIQISARSQYPDLPGFEYDLVHQSKRDELHTLRIVFCTIIIRCTAGICKSQPLAEIISRIVRNVLRRVGI